VVMINADGRARRLPDAVRALLLGDSTP
jgi:hypothetical protein